MIDTHAHLNRPEFDEDRAAVHERARAAGVTLLVEVGYDLASSEEAVAFAARNPDVRATVGVHPHDALLLADPAGRITRDGEAALARLRELAARPEVVAIGEIGLDFFRDLSPRPAQHAALAAQLRLADEVGLPVVFHTRDAYPELTAQVAAAGIPARGAVLHSFAGDADAVDWALRHRVHLGVGGPLTYKNSRLPGLLAEAAARRADPTGSGRGDLLDHLLLETDAPWLPPVPHRGERNEPAHLRYTRDRLAQVLGVTPDEVERRTDANVARLFPGAAGPDLA